MAFKEPQLAMVYGKGKKLSFPAITQPKFDGMRVLIDMQAKQAYSRNGKLMTASCQHIIDQLAEWPEAETFVFDGELLADTLSWDDTISLAKNSGRRDEAARLTFHVFDLSPVAVMVDDGIWPMTQQDRIQVLEEMGRTELSNVRVTPTVFVQNEDQAYVAARAFITMGYEGAMIKNRNGLYKFKNRNADWQKIKFHVEEDVKIIAANEGEGRLVGMLGAVTVRREDGTVYRVGTGYTDALRGELWAMHQRGELVGRTIEVVYEKTSTIGCRFPRFFRLREDKD
jgi:DNA ligase 1